MNNLTDSIAQALNNEGIRNAALILCGVILVVLAVWTYFRVVRLPRRQQRRAAYPGYGTRTLRQTGTRLPIYEPPPPAEDTRPSRAIRLPAAVTVVASSRSGTLDTQIRFSGEADWPTLSDTKPLKPARTTADDPHPTRPRRTR